MRRPHIREVGKRVGRRFRAGTACWRIQHRHISPTLVKIRYALPSRYFRLKTWLHFSSFQLLPVYSLEPFMLFYLPCSARPTSKSSLWLFLQQLYTFITKSQSDSDLYGLPRGLHASLPLSARHELR